MRYAPTIVWKTPPRWLYWVAAPLAPVFVPLGVILCLAISAVVSDDIRKAR